MVLESCRCSHTQVISLLRFKIAKRFEPSFTFISSHQLLNKLLPLHTKYHALRPEHGGFFGIIRSHFTGENGKLHLVSQVPWWDLKDKPHTDIVITTEDGQHFKHWNVPTFSHMLEPRVFSSLGYSNIAEYAKQYRHSEYSSRMIL